MRSPFKLLTTTTTATQAERSSERDALAAAIRRVVAAERAVEAARAAEARCGDMIAEARAECDNAEEALAKAREELTKSFGRAVSAGKEKPTTDDLRAARARVTDAEDALEAIRDTLPPLKEAREGAEADLERAKGLRRDAKRGVLVESIGLLLDREAAVRVELFATRKAISSMLDNMAGTPNWERWANLGNWTIAYAPRDMLRLLQPVGPSAAADPQAWAKAVAALDNDPDGRLPL